MKVKSKVTSTFKSGSPADTSRLAELLAGRLKGGEVLSLKGMIGAGKTFFVKGLARALGSADAPVSASFNLMRTYRGGLNIYHFDLFRVAEQEMENIGLEDYLGRSDGFTVIEWSESAGYLYRRSDFMEFDFELAGGDKRNIHVSASGTSAGRILKDLGKAWKKK